MLSNQKNRKREGDGERETGKKRNCRCRYTFAVIVEVILLLLLCCASLSTLLYTPHRSREEKSFLWYCCSFFFFFVENSFFLDTPPISIGCLWTVRVRSLACGNFFLFFLFFLVCNRVDSSSHSSSVEEQLPTSYPLSRSGFVATAFLHFFLFSSFFCFFSCQ
jgi:hypothetical protein